MPVATAGFNRTNCQKAKWVVARETGGKGLADSRNGANPPEVNMKTKDQQTLRILNHLITVCQDSEKGFREAAKDVKDPDYKEMLKEYEFRMRHFEGALEKEVRKLGDLPQKKGSLLGWLHRMEIYLRSELNRHDPEVVVLECERGERKAMDAYQEGLEEMRYEGLPRTVEHQFVELIEMNRRLRAFHPMKPQVGEDEFLHLR